jgi:hypothetical protein
LSNGELNIHFESCGLYGGENCECDLLSPHIIDGYKYFRGTSYLHLQGLNYLDELGRDRMMMMI